MARHAPILIAGGGIAGLSLATAFHRSGLDAELVERSPRWDAVGGGIAVQPNAMRVLHELGIGDAVRCAGATVRRWQFRDQQGELLCEIDLEELWGDVGPFIGIERPKLNAALRSDALTCRLGTWITSLRQDERHVSVMFNDGSAGEYDLVVGADGIHSAMREFAVGGTAPAYGGQMVWRSVAPIRRPPLDGIQFWLGDGCFFGLCPVAGGTYGFANMTADRFHDALGGRLERLRCCFADFGGFVREYLTALDRDDQLHCGPIEWLEAERWHCGRVVLIGDAAHASSPMMGQGGSMAMEDALVLAKTVSAATAIDAAVESFVARRKPRVDWVRQQSRAVGDMLRMPPDARNAALRSRGARVFRERFQPLIAAP